MASKDKRATYSNVVIKGNAYIRINRRCGFKIDEKTGARLPYYKDFYGKTKKEAEAKYKAYRLDNCLDENGLPDLTAKRIERRTFRELFDSWLNGIFIPSTKYAQSTKDKYIKAYNANLKNHPIMNQHIITLIGSDLQDAFNNMTCGGSTVKACLKLVRLFFKYQERQGVCSDIARGIEITQKIPHKRIDQTIEVLSSDEAAMILEGFDKHRLYLLILLAIRTGARISELLALQYSDVTDAGIRFNKQVADGGIITTTKTPASNRIVPISDNTRALINSQKQEHRKEMLVNRYKTDYIFTTQNGTLYDRHNVQRACNRVYDKIGMRHLGFHIYRHTFGSDLANKGVPIQTLASLLGHTDVSITSRYYINVSDKQKEMAIELLSV